MPIQQLTKGEIYYEIHGAGEPLFLISGLSADHHSWSAVLPMLSNYYQVIMLDNYACGQSSRAGSFVEPLTMQDFSLAIAELCDYLKISKAFFIGSSMGGAIVQQFIHDYPERAIKLVISNSLNYGESIAFQTYAKARVAGLGDSASDEFIVHIELAFCFSSAYLTPERVQRLKQLFLTSPFPQSKHDYAMQLNALLGFDSRDWLRKIQCPCLFIACDEDAITFPVNIQLMACQVPNADYLLINGSGHLPHIEKPDFFAVKVLEYLSEKN